MYTHVYIYIERVDEKQHASRKERRHRKKRGIEKLEESRAAAILFRFFEYAT